MADPVPPTPEELRKRATELRMSPTDILYVQLQAANEMLGKAHMQIQEMAVEIATLRKQVQFAMNPDLSQVTNPAQLLQPPAAGVPGPPPAVDPVSGIPIPPAQS